MGMTQATSHAPRRVPLSILDNVRIASPCPMRWEELDALGEAGSDGSEADRVRHCGQCQLNVYNFANLTREESVAVIEEHTAVGKRLCGAIYRRSDGTMLTADCPVGLAEVRRRVKIFISRAAAAALLATSAVMVHAAKQDGSWHPKARLLQPLRSGAEWTRSVADWLLKRRGPGMPMGSICLPEVPANVPQEASPMYYDDMLDEG